MNRRFLAVVVASLIAAAGALALFVGRSTGAREPLYAPPPAADAGRDEPDPAELRREILIKAMKSDEGGKRMYEEALYRSQRLDRRRLESRRLSPRSWNAIQESPSRVDAGGGGADQ